jgi:Asp/Glu/hydantoin racemase
MTIYHSNRESASWSGETIGILVLDCMYPFIPGNVANATTFDFPVRYAEVKGATVDRLIFQADPSLVEPFIQAAQLLEREGVKAITGACGFMALFQKQLQAAVDIPVFSSSLIQIPFMHILTGKRIGVITADSKCLTPEHFDGTNVGSSIPMTVRGMENTPAFVNSIMKDGRELDDDAIRTSVVDIAVKMQSDHADMGAILLECSDLPPYAHAIQSATGLPVFDFITMIEFVHRSLSRTPYSGRM